MHDYKTERKTNMECLIGSIILFVGIVGFMRNLEVHRISLQIVDEIYEKNKEEISEGIYDRWPVRSKILSDMADRYWYMLLLFWKPVRSFFEEAGVFDI